jgi:serine/threonine-protein kinase RsbT
MNPGYDDEVQIQYESDIVAARRTVRDHCMALGFSLTDTTRIVTAASELARNIFKFAALGTMYVRRIAKEGFVGIELTFMDEGPGIADVGQALVEGYSTSGGFGMGLPGAGRLMDKMEISSEVGSGLTVVVSKWRRV